MATTKLIDAHEAKAKLRSVRDWFGGPPQTEQDKLAQAVVKMCIEEIDKLRPVDAVVVCRCKDCKHAKDMLPLANATAHQMGVCTVRKEDGIEVTVWGHDFCSYGERKDNG